MAGRVTLLILMTGLFAAAWSSDHAPVKSTPVIPSSPPYSVESVRETTLHRWRVKQGESLADRSCDEKPVSTPTHIAGIVRELPAGTYLVINSPSGASRVEILEIRATSSTTGGDSDRHVREIDSAAPLKWVDLGNLIQARFSEWKSRRRKELVWRQILVSLKKSGQERSELPVASGPADFSQR